MGQLREALLSHLLAVVLLYAVTEEGTKLPPLCAENVARLLEQLSADPVQFRRCVIIVASHTKSIVD